MKLVEHESGRKHAKSVASMRREIHSAHTRWHCGEVRKQKRPFTPWVRLREQARRFAHK